MNRKRNVLPVLFMTALLSACTSGSTDTTNPSVTEVSVTTPVVTAGPHHLSAKATDDVAVQQVDFYLDDASTPFASDTSADSEGKYAATLTWNAAQNGPHTIKVVAVDTSGNKSAPVNQNVTVNIVTDTVSPTVSITGLPTATVTAPATYNVTLSATDNVAVTSLQGVLTRVDGNGQTVTLVNETLPAGEFTFPLTLDASANGTYVLKVSASDAAGNTIDTTQTFTVNIPTSGTTPTPVKDTQAPSLTITAPGTVTTAGTYNVTIKVSDNVAVASVTGTVKTPLGTVPLSGLSTSGGTVGIPIISNLLNGQHTVAITATDTSGNATTQSVTINVHLP